MARFLSLSLTHIHSVRLVLFRSLAGWRRPRDPGPANLISNASLPAGILLPVFASRVARITAPVPGLRLFERLLFRGSCGSGWNFRVVLSLSLSLFRRSIDRVPRARTEILQKVPRKTCRERERERKRERIINFFPPTLFNFETSRDSTRMMEEVWFVCFHLSVLRVVSFLAFSPFFSPLFAPSFVPYFFFTLPLIPFRLPCLSRR